MTPALWEVFGLSTLFLSVYVLFVHVQERRDLEGHYWRRGFFGHWQKYRLPRIERSRE